MQSLRRNERSSLAVDMKPAKVLGDFSVNGYEDLCLVNNENMRFLIPNFRTTSKVNFDLNKDRHKITRKDLAKFFQERSEMKYICKWILLQKSALYTMVDKTTGLNSRIFPDFVLRRGTMKDILIAATSVEIDWKFNVVRYNGTIYIAAAMKDPRKYLGMSEWQNRTCDYGYKFEQLMTGESGFLDARKDYYRVVDRSLGKHRLLIFGEIDGIDHQKYQRDRTSMDACVELKSTALQDSSWEQVKFIKYKKPMLWWAQSAVFGISEVVCGFRDSLGVVKKTEVIKVEDLPTYKSSQKTFDKNDMLKFAVRFFDWLCDIIKEDTPTVYRITSSPVSHLITSTIIHESSFITTPYMKELFPN